MKLKLKNVTAADSIETLANNWLAAKKREQQANGERIAIEEALVRLMPQPDDKATATHAVADLKVSVSYGMTVKVNSDRLQEIWDSLAPTARKAFKWSATADMKTLNGLRELAPTFYATIVPVIEAKPRKPSVSVEVE